jgi:hypothetical protein
MHLKIFYLIILLVILSGCASHKNNLDIMMKCLNSNNHPELITIDKCERLTLKEGKNT